MYPLIVLLLFEISLSSAAPAGLADEYDPDASLAIPLDAVNRPEDPRRLLRLNESVMMSSESNECFCSYGVEEGICERGEKCVKEEEAACFHAIKEKYNEETREMETLHLFGCATLERGSGASHLTCNSWRSAHYEPFSIACCYEGNFCNLNITPPPYSGISQFDYDPEGPIISSLALYVFVFAFIFFLLSIIIAWKVYMYQQQKKTQLSELTEESDVEEKRAMLLPESSGSGSGSGRTTMNQRTVAHDLKIIKVIGRGRYGEVRKALYRGSFVAVKTFYTTDEESWKNERDIYYTEMFNHENILQFVAADIWSEDSLTQMLLITDYHELGSLSDYLRREDSLDMQEALQLAHSAACGLEHLHSWVLGTEGRRKPRIAHRDIKTKNVIVKRRGVCCLADFGLAVRFDKVMQPASPKVQVGTKRYMAPEVLSITLNPHNFSHFLMADMYAFALVLWEIARRIECNLLFAPSSEEAAMAGRPEASDSSGLGSSLSSSAKGANYALKMMPAQNFPPEMSTRTAQLYVPPFEGLVTNDPSFEEMQKIVCVDGIRPPVEPSWLSSKNVALRRLTRLMMECWHERPDCRHSALKVKLELQKAIEDLKEYGLRSAKHSDASSHHLTVLATPTSPTLEAVAVS